MKLHCYWGKVSQSGNVITLDADEEKAKGPGGDGIGSALTFMEWDGSPLRLTVERRKVWRPEPWTDFWFVAREGEESDPWPMRYLRCSDRVVGIGEIYKEDPRITDLDERRRRAQRIHVTESSLEVRDDRKHAVSWSSGALHILVPSRLALNHTWSLTAPIRELGLYCEGSVVEVGIEGTAA